MRIDDEVLAVLSSAETSGCNVTLTGQLDRKLYERTNKVLEAAGGKWNRKARAHVFEADAADRMDQIILSGTVDVPKDEFDFFPSPPAVVARVLELAQIRPGMRVREPSAGRGALALPCAAAGAMVDCDELMPTNYEYLLTLPQLATVKLQDFLQAPPEPIYDRVVMNPPFSRQADIKHALHALQFLKPKCELVSVMAASISFRGDKLTTDFRELLAARGGHVETLPENSFKASGTGVNTVIVVIPA